MRRCVEMRRDMSVAAHLGIDLADYHPSIDRAAARTERDAWMSHLRQSYSRPRADAIFNTWAAEDVYVPLESEIMLMERAGLAVEVRWRRGAFAVLRARPETNRV